jgi:hypothetical protein
MSTEARTTTNQANAQFSTGPRTPEGKARSSQNALKHGLSARQLAIQPVDQEEFDELLAEYQAQINPRGAAQHRSLTNSSPLPGIFAASASSKP